MLSQKLISENEIPSTKLVKNVFQSIVYVHSSSTKHNCYEYVFTQPFDVESVLRQSVYLHGCYVQEIRETESGKSDQPMPGKLMVVGSNFT